LYRPHFRIWTIASAAALCFAVSNVYAGSSDVTCGDTFSGRGQLVGSCQGSITILSGHLKLQGFTISGTGLAAIECLGRCRIEGPGAIVSNGSTFGISGDNRVRLTDVLVAGHDATGVKSGDFGRIRIDRSTITDNGIGVRGPRIKIEDSEVSNNASSGIVSTTRGVRVLRTSVIDNGGDGIATVLTESQANRAKLFDVVVTGNGKFGVIAKNVKGRAATLEANRQDSACGTSEPCADVASVKFPKMRHGTCEKSMRIPDEFSGPVPFGAPWGACDQDFN
jgi:hypothetical protein